MKYKYVQHRSVRTDIIFVSATASVITYTRNK